jgi:surface polysaccharide O-acyltransferase-like enzyme
MEHFLTKTEAGHTTSQAAQSAPTSKSLYINYVRAIAACAVVQMHTNGAYLFTFDPAAPTDPLFVTADIFYSLLRWATPFFIMISGAMLIRPASKETTREFLLKRLRRVVAPFALWGMVYLLYPFRFDFVNGTPIDWSRMAQAFLYEDIYFHLWFIPMIVGMYLLTPVLRVFTRTATRKELEYLLVVIFVSNAGHHFFPNLLVIKHFSWLGYLGYYLLGYYLNTYNIDKQVVKKIYLLGLSLPVLNAFGTWWLSVQKGAYNEILFVYASPTVLFTTMALFLFLQNQDWDAFALRRPRIHLAVMYLANLSFGVYFAHPLILDALKNGYFFGLFVSPQDFFGLQLHPAIAGILVSTIAILLSVGLITLMRKWGLLKNWAM